MVGYTWSMQTCKLGIVKHVNYCSSEIGQFYRYVIGCSKAMLDGWCLIVSAFVALLSHSMDPAITINWF